MLEDALDVLEELTDKLKVETDPARYRELRVSESRESLIDSILIPVRIYLKGPFWSLDESEKNLLSMFAEYCDAVRHFVLYELTNHIPGSEIPDRIEVFLDKSFGIMRKTMFEPKAPKCEALFEELRNCFNEASEEMRERIKNGLDQSKVVIVGGYTPKGRKETLDIVTTKKPEKGWMSDRNLSILFNVHINTIANWRSGKVAAPKGFIDAFKNEANKEMNDCAKKYKSNREKSDAMNTKGVKRGMSEEGIYREGGNRWEKPQ